MQSDAPTPDDDKKAIAELIARQFASLSWRPGAPADWAAFGADFHDAAVLYPSARPARPQSPAEFVARMQDLSLTSLRSFEESPLGIEIRVFGHVAVAVAACEAVENTTETGRTVEMMLLVKEAGSWTIVAQAWDKATPSRPVPDALLSACGRPPR